MTYSTALRLEAGWTQEKLAQKSGIQQAIISKIERGELSVNDGRAVFLLEALGKPANDVGTVSVNFARTFGFEFGGGGVVSAPTPPPIERVTREAAYKRMRAWGFRFDFVFQNNKWHFHATRPEVHGLKSDSINIHTTAEDVGTALILAHDRLAPTLVVLEQNYSHK